MASHCSMRVILLRFSNSVSSRSILNSANHRLLQMKNSLSSLSSISPRTTSLFTRAQSDDQNCFRNLQVRKISISTPLCMGRRSSKIAGCKGAQDSKKAKLYCRIGKEVVSA